MLSPQLPPGFWIPPPKSTVADGESLAHEGEVEPTQGEPSDVTEVAAEQEEKLRVAVTRGSLCEDAGFAGGVAVSEEHVLAEVEGHFGVGFGITVSEVRQRTRAWKGTELIHVVGPTGTGVELVLGKVPLVKGAMLELQGPGLSTGDGAFPVGIRGFGVGVTGELETDDERSLTYTVEVKVDERTIAKLAMLGGKGAAKAATKLLKNSAVGRVICTVLRRFVPVVGAVLALRSARIAYQTLKDVKASMHDKVASLAQTFFDSMFVFAPLAATIGSAAVGLSRLVSKFMKFRRRKKSA